MTAYESFADLAQTIRAKQPRLGGTRLVAVDGPSGAGKTWFADRLAKELDAPTVHTDDLLDGWDDQFTFWDRLEELVLTPLREGRTATYQRYLWHRGTFGGTPVRVEPAPVVLLEGVSAARRTIRPELSMSIFVWAPPAECLRRALARDGDDSVAFRRYLERWRRREVTHFAAEATAARADLLVDASEAGAPVRGVTDRGVSGRGATVDDESDTYARIRRIPPEGTAEAGPHP